MRDRMLLGLLVAAQFVVMLDTAVMNVALPSIGAALILGPVGTAWLLNAYFLVFGGTLLIAGRAADVIGRRRMFLIGAGLLLIGALIGLSASSSTAVMLARVVQAIGAASLSPAAMSLLLARTDGRARAVWMSAWGAASTAGGAAGVALGGMIAGAFGWNAVFGLTAAASAIGLCLGFALLPIDPTGARRSFDSAGAILVTAAAYGVAFTVLAVPQQGWSSPPVLFSAAGTVAAVTLLVARERRAADPLFPPNLMGRPRIVIALAVNVLGGAARIASFVLVAFLLQRVLQMDAGLAGLAMMPTSLIGFAVSIAVLPKLLSRFGPERVSATGAFLLTVAHLIFASAHAASPYAMHILPGLALAAAGVALSFTPTTLIIANEVPRRDAGVGSSLASASAQIGGMLGIAIFAAVEATIPAATSGDGAFFKTGLSAAFTAAAAIAAASGVVTLLTLRPNPAQERSFSRPAGAGSASPAPGRTTIGSTKK